MLDVVDRLQVEDADRALEDQVRQDDPPEGGGQRAVEDQGHRPGVEHVVVRVPEAALLAGGALLLQRDGVEQAAPGAAEDEQVDRLAPARRRRILGRGDADVVAAIVLDVEVAVPGRGEGDLRQPAFQLVLLVPQLVGGVDADARGDAGGQRQTDGIEDGQVAAAPQVGGRDERAELQRDVGVERPLVVLVGFELGHDLVRRVRAVVADEVVEQRDDDEHDDRPAPPGPVDGPAAEPDPQQGAQPPGEEHGRGGDEPEQPQVALRVGPRVRVDDGLGVGFGRDAAQAHRLGAGPPATDDIGIVCHGSSPAFSGAGIKRCRRASGRIPALPAYETPCLIAT